MLFCFYFILFLFNARCWSLDDNKNVWALLGVHLRLLETFLSSLLQHFISPFKLIHEGDEHVG